MAGGFATSAGGFAASARGFAALAGVLLPERNSCWTIKSASANCVQRLKRDNKDMTFST